jgi:predicted DNA-binding transcriptional regulator AlpA
MQAIAKLLPDALAAGISKREITRLTGISRPWIERLIVHADDPE